MNEATADAEESNKLPIDLRTFERVLKNQADTIEIRTAIQRTVNNHAFGRNAWLQQVLTLILGPTWGHLVFDDR